MTTPVKKLLEDRDFLVGAFVVVGLFVLVEKKTGKKRIDVPGLYERRNTAWRGPGSFGKAPFGTQGRHRR